MSNLSFNLPIFSYILFLASLALSSPFIILLVSGSLVSGSISPDEFLLNFITSEESSPTCASTTSFLDACSASFSAAASAFSCCLFTTFSSCFALIACAPFFIPPTAFFPAHFTAETAPLRIAALALKSKEPIALFSIFIEPSILPIMLFIFSVFLVSIPFKVP